MRPLRLAPLFVAVMMTLVSGCVSYTAAPLAVESIAARQQAQRIDPDAVRAQLANLAPGYAWDGTTWNRLSLLAAALATNPRIATAQAQLESAKANARAARVRPGPTLTLSAEYALNPTEATPWLFGAAGDWPLDYGGRRRGRIESADIAVRRAAFEYAATAWQVRMDLRRAVDACTLADREQRLGAAQVQLRQRQLDAMRRRVAIGQNNRLELDGVLAAAAAADQQALQAATQAANARRALLAALGLTADGTPLTHGCADGEIPAEAAEAVAPLTDADRTRALQARSEFLQAALDYDQAESALRRAVAEQYPDIRLGPGYTWERGLIKLPFTLSLGLPSMDLGRAAIDAAEARRTQAGHALEATVGAVLATVGQADADYRAAWFALEQIRSSLLPVAASIARQADLALANGSTDRAQWAASQAGLLAAQFQELSALRALMAAQAGLEDALRRPLSGPELMIHDASKGRTP